MNYLSGFRNKAKLFLLSSPIALIVWGFVSMWQWTS
jgi:hypothetical protein